MATFGAQNPELLSTPPMKALKPLVFIIPGSSKFATTSNAVPVGTLLLV